MRIKWTSIIISIIILPFLIAFFTLFTMNVFCILLCLLIDQLEIQKRSVSNHILTSLYLYQSKNWKSSYFASLIKNPNMTDHNEKSLLLFGCSDGSLYYSFNHGQDVFLLEDIQCDSSIDFITSYCDDSEYSFHS